MRVARSTAQPVVPPATGLRERLRTETAQWHVRVEEAADVSHLMRTRDDYFGLLGRLFALHSGFESCLNAEVFGASWRAVGLDITRHGRAHLLAADISALAAEMNVEPPITELGPGIIGLRPETNRMGPARPVAGTVRRASVPTFGHAIGCLYVLEGSALGGRTVAGIVRAAVGEVPTTFLSGEVDFVTEPGRRSSVRYDDSRSRAAMATRWSPARVRRSPPSRSI